MKPGLVKIIYRRGIRRAARTTLVGRLRDRERHEEGRFTRGQVDELLKQTWIAYDQLYMTSRAWAPCEACWSLCGWC